MLWMHVKKDKVHDDCIVKLFQNFIHVLCKIFADVTGKVHSKCVFFFFFFFFFLMV
jgi:hypothetical protein